MDSQDIPLVGDPQIGDVIVDKYQLKRLLGVGGMGMVYAASHLELDRTVAVKFVHASSLENPEVSARFLREAKAVVKIQSEHVAQVIDVGRLENGTPFIVMEYLEGRDLSEILSDTDLSVPQAVDYVIQACAAMVEAHHLGIVHRDLKPANLFVTQRRDGSALVKVLDFGISKWNADVSQAQLTNPAALMGSPAYMSPEQLQSATGVDHRTDIWSLGVILYESLVRAPVFDAETLPMLMTAIMQREPEPLESVRADVPLELADVVHQCLVKNREHRYQTVAELASALLPFAPRRSVWTVDRISRTSGLDAPTSGRHAVSTRLVSNAGLPTTVTANAWSETSPPPRPRPQWVLPLVAAGAVAMVGAVVLILTRTEQDHSGPPAATLSTAETNAEMAGSAPQPTVSAAQIGTVPSSSAAIQPTAIQPSDTVVGTPVASGPAPVLAPPPALPASSPPAPLVHRPAAAPRPKKPPAPVTAPKPVVRPQKPAGSPLDMDLK